MISKTLTGSSGAPLADGSARGLIAAAVSSAATGVCVRLLDVPEGDYLAYIQPGVVFGAFMLGAVYDRYLRLKVPPS